MILENPVKLLCRENGEVTESSIVLGYIPKERRMYFQFTANGDGIHGLLPDKYFELHKDKLLLLMEAALLNAGVELPDIYGYHGVISSNTYGKITVR